LLHQVTAGEIGELHRLIVGYPSPLPV
jgi:hypothetical protein